MRRIQKAEDSYNSIAIRTDFSDESAWKSICEAINNPDNEFEAFVDFINDTDYDGLKVEHLPSVIPEHTTFVFIIDRTSLKEPDHPILAMDLFNEPGGTFRVIPSQMGVVSSNLCCANMGFEEFADSADESGVFRGFPK